MKTAKRMAVYAPLALIGLAGISAAMMSGTADLEGIMTYPGMSIARIWALTITSLTLAGIVGSGVFGVVAYRQVFNLN